MVGAARELEVGVEGNVSLAELREFLLTLPDLPPETVRQLRAIEDWRTTLPIPVPVDQIAWQPVTIAGGPGLLLADDSGIGSGALLAARRAASTASAGTGAGRPRSSVLPTASAERPPRSPRRPPCQPSRRSGCARSTAARSPSTT